MQVENARNTGRLQPGDVFVDRFEVRDFLGAGGEFDVYFAWDRETGEEVALKVLVLPGDPRFGQTVASTAADDIAARRDALASLLLLHRDTLDAIEQGSRGGEHEQRVAIARVWEVSFEGAPKDWFVIEELVRSAFTLGDWLRIERDGRRALGALAQLGRLLAHLHERGVVHRDVHGGNVLVDGDGRLWFTDFSHAIRPLHHGAFALLSPWNAPEERAHAPLTASADVYGFARLVIEALGVLRSRLREGPAKHGIFARIEEIHHRYVDCAPDARGSLIALLDDLRAIERELYPPRETARPQRSAAIAFAVIALGSLAFAALRADRSSRVVGSTLAPIPVTEVRLTDSSLPRWSDGAPVAVSSVAPSQRAQPVRSTRRLDSNFAATNALFRGDAPASERLADYAASEFLREAHARARRGWGAACLRTARPSSSDASATFRVTLSPARDSHGGRVDGVELLRSQGLDERTAQCLKSRIANIAAADPGQTIEAELSLRLAREEARRAAL